MDEYNNNAGIESLLVALANQTTEALIVLDEKLTVVLFNDVARKIFICSSAKAIGTSFKSICELFGVNYFIDLHNDRIKSMLPLKVSSVIYNRKIMWRVLSVEDNGSIFYLLKTLGLEEKDNLNEIHQLETLIENMPCNVYWMDKECIMSGCNQNVLTMLNMTCEQFKGKTYEELSILCNWPEGLANRLKSDDKFVLKTGKAIVGIEDPPIPHANGTYSQFLTSRVPLRNNDGNIVGVAGISTEITALKDAKKKAEEAITAKIHAESAALLSNIKAEMG